MTEPSVPISNRAWSRRVRSHGLVAIWLWAGAALGANAPLITFGPEAPPGKGDDDFREEVFIRVPEDTAGPLQLRILDPDVGGQLDEPLGLWNTRTRFSLYGAAASGSAPLASATFAEDPATDGRWWTLADFAPEQGRLEGDERVFRLLVEGVEGDDGNLYEIRVSGQADAERSPPGLRLLSYRPTISVPPGRDRFAEARLALPAGTQALHLRNFDLDRAAARLEQPFAPPRSLTSSGEAQWREDGVALEAPGEVAAVVVRGGRKLLNDLVLEARDQDGRPIPFSLPVQMAPEAFAPRPEATFEVLPDCRSVAFDASRSQGVGHRLIGYRWDFGDGQVGQGIRPRHSYGDAGTYQVALTVIDDSGRVLDRARRVYPVKVNRAPEAVPGPPQVVAPGDPVTLDGQGSSDADGRIRAYSWDFGDGTQARGRRAVHAYAEPGRYQARLSVEDDGPGPCTSSSAVTEIWVNAAPQAQAGADRVLSVGEKTRLDAGASRDPDGKLLAYRWDLGDGQQAEGPLVEHAYHRPGRYEVRLEVQDDAGVGNSLVSDRVRIWVNDPPVARIQAEPKGAVGETLVFDAGASTDSDGALTAFHWDFGDGQVADGLRVEHAFAAPGAYRVALRVRDDSGSGTDEATAEQTVVINDPPVADAGEDQLVTASAVRFDGTGSRDPDGRLSAWDWDFGDGGAGEGPTPTHVYAAPGRYQVTLTVTDDSGTRSDRAQDSMTLMVNASPIADAGPDRRALPGETIQLDGSGSLDPDGVVAEYRWDFGDGSTATGARPSHAYAEPGVYPVRLEVRDETGQADALGYADAVVRVNAPPLARAGADRLVAPGEEVLLDGSASYDPDGEIRLYRWIFSDGEPGQDGMLARRRFDAPGTYSATLEVTDDSGLDNGLQRDQVSIRVNHAPTAVPGPAIDRCGMRVELDGSGSLDPDGDRLIYTWSFGDGTPSVQGARVAHHFPGGGRYPVVLTLDDQSGVANATDSASTMVWIHRPPLAVAEMPDLACAGELVLFNGARSEDPDGGRLLFEWDFGDGSQAQEPSPAKAYARGGVYRVRLTARDDSGLDCDRASDQRAIRIVEAPVAEAGEDMSVCANTPVTFDGTGSRDFDGVVNGYAWDFGDGTKGGGPNPTHLYSAAGAYRVTLTITGDQVGSCDNQHSDQLLVQVLDAPRLALDAPAAIPVDVPAIFEARPLAGDAEGRADGLRYEWELGDGSRAEGRRVEHRYAQPGRYQLTLLADDGSGETCSRLQIRHSVLVNAPPLADAGPDREVAPGEPVRLDGSASSDPDGAIRRFHWDLGDGSEGEGVELWHRYERPGTYEAVLRVSDDTELANREGTARAAIQVNAGPIPSALVEPEVPCPGEEVVLDASASADPDGAVTGWAWRFGDGGLAEGAQARHVYAEPGRYLMRLEVTDDSPAVNATGVLTREIRVNQAPRARLGRPPTGCPGSPIRFDAAASYDADGRVRGHEWSFGDGSSSEGEQVEHVYDEPGRYPVVLRISDDSGSSCATDQARAEAVVNAAPRAQIQASAGRAYVEGAHEGIRFDGTGSVDPDGDPLTYRWDFGDGSSGRGAKVMHRFERPGRYRVLLQVRDDSGTDCATGEASVEIQVEKERGGSAG